MEKVSWSWGLDQRQLCQAMKIACYEPDVTETLWELIEPMLPAAKNLGRKRKSLRKILNALLHVAKAGCRWRLLPVDFPPWQTVYAMFRRWIAEGVWERADARLRTQSASARPNRARLAASATIARYVSRLNSAAP